MTAEPNTAKTPWHRKRLSLETFVNLDLELEESNDSSMLNPSKLYLSNWRKILPLGLFTLLLLLFTPLHGDLSTWALNSTSNLRSSVSSSFTSSSPSVPVDFSYRKHLEAQHGPVPSFRSPTLGFSHIYVLSLPKRIDRRERMSKLAKALGLHFTFVDATSKDSNFIRWIGERTAEIRRLKRKLLADTFALPDAHVGGMMIGSMWLEPSLPDLMPFARSQDPLKGGELERIRPLKFSDPAVDRYHGQDWVSWFESQDVDTLVPDDPQFNITEALWDPLERIDSRQMNSAALATWYSQTRVMQKILDNRDEMSLILEDDVDVEWDIGRIWPNVLKHLPRGSETERPWDVTFLGHCWGHEQTQPKLLHPLLHQSTMPRCLHGYALTRTGAQEILRILRDPWIAFQTPIDTAIPTFIRMEVLKAFSLDPSIIIQSKDTPSDIQPGIGSLWRGTLADSTMERIWRDEGHEIPDVEIETPESDPASRVLYKYPREDGPLDTEGLPIPFDVARRWFP